MKRLLPLVILLWCEVLSAQPLQVQAIVRNEQGEVVHQARIELNELGHVRKAISDRKGKATLPWNRQFPTSIVISHPGYKNYRYELLKKDLRKAAGDTIFLHVKLETFELKPAVVRAYLVPDTIFGSKEVSIADYVFCEDGMFLLTYEATLNKGARIILNNLNGESVASCKAPDGARGFYQDWMGRVYVLADNQVFHVYMYREQIELNEVDNNLFYEHIYPINDSLSNGALLFNNFTPTYPSFGYFHFQSGDTAANRFCTITDNWMMELYLAEFKYVPNHEKLWAFRQEIRTGVRREVWIGAKYFTNSLYYKVLYAPLFVINDTIHVFDHYGNQLIRYNEWGAPIDSVAIAYHQMQRPVKWKNKILHDASTGKVYALAMDGPRYALVEINRKTGKAIGVQRLYFKYSENITVHDGKVYYIYRPFESSQKKFLYAEPLVVYNGIDVILSEK